MNLKSIFQKTGLVIISVLFSLVGLELLLRLAFPVQTKYLVWQPGLQHHFYPDTNIIGGVAPRTSFTINRYGVRTDTQDLLHGPDMFDVANPSKEKAHLKYYLCIGASTTEGLYLDDSKTWPSQFSKAALACHDSTFGYICNLAKSGCTMRENYIHLKYCVPQYKAINTVFVMGGLNDMTRRLSQDTLYQNTFQFTPSTEDSFVNTIFLKQGRGQGKTWWRRTALFYVSQNAYHKSRIMPIEWQVQDSSGKIYEVWRKHRQVSNHFLDTLPDMTGALDEYGYIINLMIDEAEKQKLQIIFLNESAIWKDSMPETELQKLWQGGLGKFQMEPGHTYYSPKALRHGLELYNQKLDEVCKARHIRVIDIDSKLPHDLSTFYDDCHFTVEGARKVGTLVYDAVRK